MAAHNLRESLRDVAAYSQLMTESPDGSAEVYLARIQEGAARAQSLLGDVVDYWATGTGAQPSSRTDMEAVLRQALLSMDQQIAERTAIVTHDPLPAVIGDFEILTKVLRHLIKNAGFCRRADLQRRDGRSCGSRRAARGCSRNAGGGARTGLCVD
jgi:chemotaxis family two-component system sensor kinase Cph1